MTQVGNFSWHMSMLLSEPLRTHSEGACLRWIVISLSGSRAGGGMLWFGTFTSQGASDPVDGNETIQDVFPAAMASSNRNTTFVELQGSCNIVATCSFQPNSSVKTKTHGNTEKSLTFPECGVISRNTPKLPK